MLSLNTSFTKISNVFTRKLILLFLLCVFSGLPSQTKYWIFFRDKWQIPRWSGDKNSWNLQKQASSTCRGVPQSWGKIPLSIYSIQRCYSSIGNISMPIFFPSPHAIIFLSEIWIIKWFTRYIGNLEILFTFWNSKFVSDYCDPQGNPWSTCKDCHYTWSKFKQSCLGRSR